MASYTAIKDYLEYKGRIGSANNSPTDIRAEQYCAKRPADNVVLLKFFRILI